MSKVSLEQWRMFAAVVEEGGFHHAAKAVHKSVSSVHSAVQKIEELLEIRLFTVVGREAQLTPAGELLHRRSMQGLEAANQLERIAKGLAAGEESILSSAVDEAFPRAPLTQALEKLGANSVPQGKLTRRKVVQGRYVHPWVL